MKDEDYNKLIEEINNSLKESKLIIQIMKTPSFDFVFREIDYQLQQPISSSKNNLQSQQEIVMDSLYCTQSSDREISNEYDEQICLQVNQIQNQEKSKNSTQLEQILNKYFQQNINNQNQAFNYTQEVQKYNIKTKIPISSISEALEKEEEEESNRQTTPNNQQLYYFCQISKPNSSQNSEKQKTSKPPSSINSEKFYQELNQHDDFSCDMNTALELLNTDDKLKFYENKNLNESQKSNNQQQLQQNKKFQSTASESQFDAEFDEVSLHLSDIDGRQVLQKQLTINSETTQIINKQQAQIPSCSYLQSHQTQPYLIDDINSLDDQNSEESLVSFYNEKGETSSSVFEVQDSKLLQNFFEEDISQKLNQQLNYPIDLQSPILDCAGLINNEKEDMQQILSPLYSNNYFIDQQNFHQLNLNNIECEEFVINQKQSIQSQDNYDYDEIKITQLESELEQINKKIISRSSQNSITNFSSQTKQVKPTHLKIKSSLISTQEASISQPNSRKNSQINSKEFISSIQNKNNNKRLSLQLFIELPSKSHETFQAYKKIKQELKQANSQKSSVTQKINFEQNDLKNFKTPFLQSPLSSLLSESQVEENDQMERVVSHQMDIIQEESFLDDDDDDDEEQQNVQSNRETIQMPLQRKSSASLSFENPFQINWFQMDSQKATVINY